MWTHWTRFGVTGSMEVSLQIRRLDLRQYEVESYAAIGRIVVECMISKTRSAAQLSATGSWKFLREIRVLCPIAPIGEWGWDQAEECHVELSGMETGRIELRREGDEK